MWGDAERKTGLFGKKELRRQNEEMKIDWQGLRK